MEGSTQNGRPINVIVIEDDEGTRQKHVERLKQHKNLSIDTAAAFADADRLIKAKQYDLAIVDVMIDPDQSHRERGFKLAALLHDRNCVVIVVSGAPKSYAAGVADSCAEAEFITKPVDEGEFHRAVQRALRLLANPPATRPGQFPPGLSLDPEKRFDMLWNGKSLRLTPTESELVHLLATNANQTITKEDLAKKLTTGGTTAVKGHMRSIRLKFEGIDVKFSHIYSEFGVGYVWRV
jgi:two-component system phosphate regulon response regulator OmpR